MLNRFLIFVILLVIAGLAWVVNLKYPDVDAINLVKVSYSFTAIAVSYLFLKLLLAEFVSNRIKDQKTRYTFRKTTQTLFLLISFIIVLRVWVVDPQALLVAYGLVAAGVAIALQDVFKNFAGAFTILTSDIYSVGDRIEVNSKYGDVMDIGLFYTTLLEIREWVDGDQATGRITMLPNGQILSSAVNNYTKDHQFMWDELSVPITYESDWKKAIAVIEGIIQKETASVTKKAEKEISHLSQKYYLSKRNIEPKIYVTPTDNWIMLRARYVVDPRNRRIVQSKLFTLALEALQNTPEVAIASQTLTITNVPKA